MDMDDASMHSQRIAEQTRERKEQKKPKRREKVEGENDAAGLQTTDRMGKEWGVTGNRCGSSWVELGLGDDDMNWKIELCCIELHWIFVIVKFLE